VVRRASSLALASIEPRAAAPAGLKHTKNFSRGRKVAPIIWRHFYSAPLAERSRPTGTVMRVSVYLFVCLRDLRNQMFTFGACCNTLYVNIIRYRLQFRFCERRRVCLGQIGLDRTKSFSGVTSHRQPRQRRGPRGPKR